MCSFDFCTIVPAFCVRCNHAVQAIHNVSSFVSNLISGEICNSAKFLMPSTSIVAVRWHFNVTSDLEQTTALKIYAPKIFKVKFEFSLLMYLVRRDFLRKTLNFFYPI